MYILWSAPLDKLPPFATTASTAAEDLQTHRNISLAYQSMIAANAAELEMTNVTPEPKFELTELLSPPCDEGPQVTTEPSDFKAANAQPFE